LCAWQPSIPGGHCAVIMLRMMRASSLSLLRLSCAAVPTTISDNAVAILNQIEINVAASDIPSHNVDKAHVSVIANH